jgi:hypothetical protein
MAQRATSGKGARAKIRAFLLQNVGKVVDYTDIRAAAGNATEWARRLRELRNEEGMNIVSHNDRSDLKPGQYMLVDTAPLPAFERGMSKQLRAFVLDRNGFTCQMCGAAAGEPHPSQPSQKTRLHIGHIIDKSMGGTDDPQNLRAVCSVCNEGAANTTLERPQAQKLLAQIRRAPGSEKVKVLQWLVTKFPHQAQDVLAKYDRKPAKDASDPKKR